MSIPEASGTRQRTNNMTGADDDEKTDNPASLSGNPNKKVPRNKPVVKRPFVDVSMSRLSVVSRPFRRDEADGEASLTYMMLGLLALAGFYVWRFTVWAGDVGGYWALITGHHHPKTAGTHTGMEDIAASVASSAASAQTARGSGKPEKSGDDIQTQIYSLANALGIKPAALSAAIRPLIDPSAPNPADVAKMEAEVFKQQVAANQAEEKKEGHGSLLGMVGEALLD